jgi:hypothetical protein
MIRRNVISGSVCLAFGLFVYWLTGQVPAQASLDMLGGRFFPRVVTVLFILSSLGLIATGLMGIEISGGQVGGKKGQAAELPEPAEPATEPEPLVFGIPAGTARLLGYVVGMATYTVILPLVGYIVASLLAFSGLIFTTGERRPLHIVSGSVAITALLYILFAVIFSMNVPEASLF